MCTGVIFIQHLIEVCTMYSYVCFLHKKEKKENLVQDYAKEIIHNTPAL